MFVLNNRLSETDEIINMILNLGGVGDYVFFIIIFCCLLEWKNLIDLKNVENE